MKPYYQADDVLLYLGRFEDVMPSLPPGLVGHVDAVLTDPPYAREYLPLWEPLARQSCRLLKRGGSLLSILPTHALPFVCETIGQWLKYRWLLAMWQDAGAHPRMAMGVEVVWKPIGWWVKGAYPTGRGFRRDGFVNSVPDKRLHQWAQSSTWAENMLLFVPKGGIVCDPMMGAGTLILAARAAGHQTIGIDSDEACCEMTAKQLEAQR